MLTAATDGTIAVWNLSEAYSSIDTSTDAPAPSIPCLCIPAHQSGVNSLAVWTEELRQQDDGCLVTVASGGDDGQLTVSLIRVQFSEDGDISESEISLQTQPRHSNLLQLYLQSQSHNPLAHAAPLTALKLLSPGFLVSTSSDQRVCLWRVCSTGIRHMGTLCSHVADAAGLAVWEGQRTEEGDERSKTRFERFESKHQNAIWGVKGSQTDLEAKGQEGRRLSEDKETDKAADGEPVESVSATGDTVCTSSNDEGRERAGECRNETEAHSVDKTEREVSTEKALKACENRARTRAKTGWVLICGQGLQLLRVRNTDKPKSA